MPKFFNQDLAELAHQLTLSPRRLRLQQIQGMERLLGLIEPDRAYPFEFVCFHITKYHKKGASTSYSIPGKALMCDLVTLAEVVSRKAALTVGELQGTYESHEQLAERLQVSTKTIRRWRNRGLMGIRAVFEDGVNRLAFLRSAVDQFTARNKVLVGKAASFRQLSGEERDAIVGRAREILGTRRLKLHGVAKLIAEETGRAVETVRYTLRRHDESPDSKPLFHKAADAFECEQQAAMWRAHEAGEPVARLAATFESTCDEVERVLRRIQVRNWREAPPAYVPNEIFEAPNAEALILDAPEPPPSNGPLPKPPRDLPAYLRSLYMTPLLSAAQEQDLFRRYNFLKWQAAKAVNALRPESASAEAVGAVRSLLGRVDEMRGRIVQANLRLVVSIAKKYVGWSEDFYEIISDGNMSLMRAVEKFDFALGNKFSTYASWAIMKNYARSIPEDHYYCKRFVTGQEAVLDAASDSRPVDAGEADRTRVRELLAEGMQELSEREREVLSNHYGLESKGVGETLEQIGKRFGVTKERVRQIEQQAMNRLRGILAPSLAEVLD